VKLCVEDQSRLLLVTKRLYPEVAKQYKTTWHAVERNIRTAGTVVWNRNRALLEKLAHCQLIQQPCSAQLLAILSTYFLTL